mmetsp:Transcript_113173/g.300691  ORF Transcript_113173/g.300691 Transcript_113173/m.300691 type:complete len:239 (-) Transcript_113173:385-1101(-)
MQPLSAQPQFSQTLVWHSSTCAAPGRLPESILSPGGRSQRPLTSAGMACRAVSNGAAISRAGHRRPTPRAKVEGAPLEARAARCAEPRPGGRRGRLRAAMAQHVDQILERGYRHAQHLVPAGAHVAQASPLEGRREGAHGAGGPHVDERAAEADAGVGVPGDEEEVKVRLGPEACIADLLLEQRGRVVLRQPVDGEDVRGLAREVRGDLALPAHARHAACRRVSGRSSLHRRVHPWGP